MFDLESLRNRRAALKEQREQAVTTIKMVDGALQVLDAIEEEMTAPSPKEAVEEVKT